MDSYRTRYFWQFVKFAHFFMFVMIIVLTICSAIRDNFFYEVVFVLRNTFIVAPAVLDLLLILTSFYLMLDGVYRWGFQKGGAFSRTLIGLFILHTSSAAAPLIPCVFLFLELILCVTSSEDEDVEGKTSSSEVCPEFQLKALR